VSCTQQIAFLNYYCLRNIFQISRLFKEEEEDRHSERYFSYDSIKIFMTWSASQSLSSHHDSRFMFHERVHWLVAFTFYLPRESDHNESSRSVETRKMNLNTNSLCVCRIGRKIMRLLLIYEMTGFHTGGRSNRVT